MLAFILPVLYFCIIGLRGGFAKGYLAGLTWGRRVDARCSIREHWIRGRERWYTWSAKISASFDRHPEADIPLPAPLQPSPNPQ